MKKAAISSQPSAAGAALQIEWIPVEQLFVSPEETRKNIDQEALKELAESIRTSGVLECLLVRPAPRTVVEKGGPPFEIVAGQRRWLASKLAGKAVCPCEVRLMTDEEARQARIVSNLQREDLPPMDEAEAYGKLLEAPGATIESIAAALAKSPSYVGRRLKLLDAIEPVHAALKAGAIEVGHALELARLSAKQQSELLEYLNVGYAAPDADDDDAESDEETEGSSLAEHAPGTCVSCGSGDEELLDNELTWANPGHTVCSDPDCVAEARRKGLLVAMVPTRTTVAELRGRIARTELRVLRDVPFPLDEEMPPMACTECPKHAAGAASLFADIAEDTCTDPTCLEQKLRTWVKAQLYRAEREGRTLAMLFDGHAADKAGVSRWDCVIGAGCASSEAAIWVTGARTGHCVQICRDKKCAEHGAGAASPSSSGGTKGGLAVKPAASKQSAEEKRRAEAQRAERQKLLGRVRAEKAYRERLWKQIAGADVPAAAEPQIVRQACAMVACQGGGHVALALGFDPNAFEYGKRDDALMRVAALPYEQVLRAAALALASADLGVSEYGVTKGLAPEQMERVATWLGIDLKAARGGDGAKTGAKSKAKPAAKPEKGQRSRPAARSAAAKKRIAEAQRKRWAESRKTAKKAGRK